MPGTTTYYLWDEAEGAGAEWIKIKNQITYGDEQDMAGKVVKSIKIPENATEDEKMGLKREVEMMLDVAIDGPFKILVWVVDWNLKDQSDKSVDLDFDSVRQLSLAYAPVACVKRPAVTPAGGTQSHYVQMEYPIYSGDVPGYGLTTALGTEQLEGATLQLQFGTWTFV